jgi:hypothetical protein
MSELITEDNKWEVYEQISHSMCKQHSLEQLSGWLSDLSDELGQWSLRASLHGTPYKKDNLLQYIDTMSMVTVLLMAVHCKIKETNPDLYSVVERGVMTSFYNEYCED